MDKILVKYLESEGYAQVREVPGQGLCGIMGQMFTIAVVCNLDETGYAFRYCFPREIPGAAEKALLEWSGEGDIVGPWIKRKGKGGDMLNPNYNQIFSK